MPELLKLLLFQKYIFFWYNIRMVKLVKSVPARYISRKVKSIY